MAQTTSTGNNPGRIPQAERSARMRERLARAAFEVIRDHGYVNFRTAAVARAAGVSQGAQLHHFPTKNSLAEAAIEHAWGQADIESAARLETHRADDDVIDALLADSRAFFFSDYFRVALDILMAGGNDPELRAALVASTLAHRGRIERLWLAKLVDGGCSLDEAEDILALTFSLVRGFAVRALVEPGPERYERLCERWATMLRTARAIPGARPA
ncbi:MAG: TetR/AcrR family transcriptional regulator [Gammaproteobacteria bacterium]